MKTHHEALVVHGAGLTPDEELTEKAVQRMDTAISAWNEGVAENMVVSGGYSFMLDTPPSVSEAFVMKRYGLNHGLSAKAIHIEDESLDTIGNALYTKSRYLIPNGWVHPMVVTSRSHLPRTLEIFQHVMGDDFEVTGIAAPEKVTLKDQAYEAVGATMMREILRGTKPGDDEAIRERLERLVPGYADGTKRNLAIQSFLGIFRQR